jgi:hypothetical protein
VAPSRACADRLHRPAGPRAGLDRGGGGASIERQGKVFINRFLLERFVFDFEVAVRQRDMIQRLTRARHRIDQAQRQHAGVDVRVHPRIRPGRVQFDRGRVRRARGGDPQRTVGLHPKLQHETVQLEPANLYLESGEREDVETDPAAGGRDDRPAVSIANLNAAKSEADAVGAAHQGGRADRHPITRAEPFLQAARQARLQAIEADGAGGEQIEKPAAQRQRQRQNQASEARGGARDAPHAQPSPPGAPQSRPRAGPQQSV